MSKEAALRAMREARYEELASRSSATPGPTRRPVRPAQPRATQAPAEPDGSTEPTEQLCGHRSMNGRTCTREHGHAAKSHRYS